MIKRQQPQFPSFSLCKANAGWTQLEVGSKPHKTPRFLSPTGCSKHSCSGCIGFPAPGISHLPQVPSLGAQCSVCCARRCRRRCCSVLPAPRLKSPEFRLVPRGKQCKHCSQSGQKKAALATVCRSCRDTSSLQKNWQHIPTSQPYDFIVNSKH